MKKKVKRYPSYKESGIEWIGNIPESWEVKPLYVLFSELKNKNFGNLETNVLSLSYGNIVSRNVETNMGLLPESFETYNIVNEGNIVLRLTDLQNDKKSLRCGYVKRKGIITSAYTTLQKKREEFNSYFYYFLLHSYDISKVFYNLGAGVRQSMSFSDLKRMPLLVMSLAEQTQIVKFLEEKIADIDSLITDKEKLIELLEEQRQSVIAEAVTKGLDPNVNMKDSGVEWIGEIPEHWEEKRIKYLFSEVNDRNFNEEAELLSLFTSIGVRPRKDMEQKGNKSQTVINYKIVRKGDIVVNKLLAWMGSIGISKFDGVTSPDYDVYRPLNKDLVNKDYYHYYFRNFYFKGDCYKYGRGIMLMRWRTYSEDFKKILVTLPPIEEQNQIANYLDKISNEIDYLIDNNLKVINKLKEYRQSLIYEAVTGKIDVREMVDVTKQGEVSSS
ncbi:restriction endonuclease subunit S [Bacillus shivajii]|uniref:restriction endonuclease subunit S n=1 Tax=Bacillus shivajii TaxID=1983719 RepID=UPI001CFBD2F3|nr:restriction endonuclease subunit S [Bacillus shivajii]UCZ53720.1 restriction endonuclease subunit S [Bacillus shivajii]